MWGLGLWPGLIKPEIKALRISLGRGIERSNMTPTNNRELSWLAFNDRVLQEACDPAVPLMQRLRFLGIFSSNQDEFIKVRLAGLVRMARSKTKSTRLLPGGYLPGELLPLVKAKIDKNQ